MTEADRAYIKLDRLCDELRHRIPLGDPAWELIDGVYEDIEKLHNKAYLTIRLPWARKRVSGLPEGS